MLLMEMILNAAPEPPQARKAHEKMQDYRNRLRAAGLRPVQYWVPDLRRADIRGQIAAGLRDTKGDQAVLTDLENMLDWQD